MAFTKSLPSILFLLVAGCGSSNRSSTAPSPPQPSPRLASPAPASEGANSLWGITYAYPSKPGDISYTAYGGIKIEILDGPLAGAFTFSNDDDNGEYWFRDVPAGLVHVRASGRSTEPQTQEVEVAGRTRLDFVIR